ncbi:polymeric immunoglobulin receptor-like [Poeciliopsis prolifica]|uniref:polymeric immunoglobulin receptor-like n=1 Tax=Poeciliopsis prolifica TaxID=188132 RepID=UPI00241378D6|nr:polymeric immunoglobulin receptor-like [Poeciliopsis prolifica]
MKTTTPLVSEELTEAPVSSAAGSIQVFGYEGGDVNLSCPYDRGFEGRQKYLCNNNCRYADVLITTSQGSSGKYSIHDDKTTRVFTVTISALRLHDAGKYWCGVTRIGKDISIERKLEVKADRCCDTVNKIQSTEEGSVTISCSYDSQSVDKLKFFCRGNRSSTCRQQAVITSSNTQNGRFRLSDDRKSRIFTVTISSLTLKDSGSYLCGVQRISGFDVFYTVELEVKAESCCAKSQNMSGVMEHSVTFLCPYAPQHPNDTMFLCKGDRASNCTNMMDQSRFILINVSSSSFSVTVTKLEAGDAGTYWCGSGPEAMLETPPASSFYRCCDTVNKIQSTEEGSVTISCSYDSQSVDKLKFFCRGNRPSTCRQQAVINSSNTQDGRFRLSDDRKSRIFTVTISTLTLKDSGSYLCGVQRISGFDVFSAVELEVKEWCCVESKNVSFIVGRAVTFQCPYPRHHRNNMMFLCKGDQRSNCTYMTYQAEDSGTYWCRSDPEWSVGNYTQFHLTVDEEEQRGVSEESVIKALYWLFAALPVLLLILIIILVKVCKTKRRQLTAVDMNTSKLEAVDAQDVTSEEDMYNNHAMFSQQKRTQRTESLSGDADEYTAIYEN